MRHDLPCPFLFYYTFFSLSFISLPPSFPFHSPISSLLLPSLTFPPSLRPCLRHHHHLAGDKWLFRIDKVPYNRVTAHKEMKERKRKRKTVRSRSGKNRERGKGGE